jgi:transcriptional regulator with XRE-family HTH domain
MNTPTNTNRRGPNYLYPADDDREVTGASLREARLNKGVTMDELATAIGYANPGSIAQIESGLRPLSDPKLKAAAKFLGVHPTSIRRPRLKAIKGGKK